MVCFKGSPNDAKWSFNDFYAEKDFCRTIGQFHTWVHPEWYLSVSQVNGGASEAADV